jgi:GNAT superfamily N-acetyltransferase
MNEKIVIRKATEKDVGLVLQFIKELAEYEKMLDDVKATEEILHNSMFVKNAARCLLAYYDDKPVGFALYFYNFSTFTGKRGLYLEDLYVKEEYRNKKIGKSLLKELVNICKEEDLQRFE